MPAVVVATLGVLMIGACLWLDLVNDPADRDRAMMGWGTVSAVVGTIAVATAVPVLWRYPRHPVAWVIAATGLFWAFDGLCESWSAYGLAHTPPLPLTGFAVWIVAQVGAFLLVGLPLVLVLYPTGRLMPGRWRVVSIVVIAMACTLPVSIGSWNSSAVSAEVGAKSSSTGSVHAIAITTMLTTRHRPGISRPVG